MTHRGGLILCVIAVRVLTAVGDYGTPIFDPTSDLPVFETLRERKCLPDDFVIPGTTRASNLVYGSEESIVGNGSDQCADVPVLLQILNCVIGFLGLVDSDSHPPVFDRPTAIANIIGRSHDHKWTEDLLFIFKDCEESALELTGQKKALYTFLCLRWSLFATCDQQQDVKWGLDDDGILRRANFLTGTCPLSPYRLMHLLEKISHTSWAMCGVEVDGDVEVYDQYVAEGYRITCLLQGFTNPHGFMDFPKLKAAIIEEISEFPEGVQLLTDVVIPCGAKKHTDGWSTGVTAEDFVRCWARKGLFGCVYQEAYQEVDDFPSGCTCDELPDSTERLLYRSSRRSFKEVSMGFGRKI